MEDSRNAAWPAVTGRSDVPSEPGGGRYSLPARILHWILAPLVLAQVYLGWVAGWQRHPADGLPMLNAHFQIGFIILGLMTLRLLWRVGHRPPAPPTSEPRWRHVWASVTHVTIYVLILTMPISGYVLWVWMKAPMDLFGLIELPRVFQTSADDTRSRYVAWVVHHYSALLLSLLLALHVTAALWHEFVVRDGLIRKRML
ncbi:MAG: cytochrome b [Actinomycetota bacterium]|nr:cytochrome b [Actinomycetota bacterium]